MSREGGTPGWTGLACERGGREQGGRYPQVDGEQGGRREVPPGGWD